ncbi:hypothetical protein AVEN_169274-1 [Araneus ventricosus]|uniref:Uncharacterized protein n=1 Tax=Araneus ventricosus TaxID=182803 RepID=A0A4Y2PWW2_ARAVE|nr:hypothetical protein AVEN_169274-1 [Araneus ventricosus]
MSQRWGRRVAGSKPISTEIPPNMWACSLEIKLPTAGGEVWRQAPQSHDATLCVDSDWFVSSHDHLIAHAHTMPLASEVSTGKFFLT